MEGMGKAYRKRIIFIPTWRCQLNCSYCDYTTKSNGAKGYDMEAFGNKFFIKEELHWAYWLALLSKFRPYHIEFTGGEPTMWDGIVEFLAHLPEDSSWAVTSNTLIPEAVEKITPANCLCWTASYHYHSKDKFVENLKMLRLRGFPLQVTLVLTPKNEEKVNEMIDVFSESRIGVSIHPMLKQGFSWKEHKPIIDRVRKRAMKAEGEHIHFVDAIRGDFIPDGPQDECPAGMYYFTLFPDGKVYRCYADGLSKAEEPLGDIWTFEPNEKKEPCKGGCIFPCDLEVRDGRYEI